MPLWASHTKSSSKNINKLKNTKEAYFLVKQYLVKQYLNLIA